jgi:hypothetical protein
MFSVFAVTPTQLSVPYQQSKGISKLPDKMGFDLTRGYLFRLNPPIMGFKILLYVLSIRSWPEGLFTTNACPYWILHGIRSGGAITLALTRANLSEIMDHVGWNPRHTALYSLQLAQVLNPSAASAKLAFVTVDNCCNKLKRFFCALPTVISTAKRRYPSKC